MILQSIEYDVSNLLHGSDAVAAVQLDGDALKNMVLAVRETGWGLVIVETPKKEHFLIFAANRVHAGNLVGDVRTWHQELGYDFFLKRSDEEWATPTPKSFILTDGREVQIATVLSRASNFTHWALEKKLVLPDPYVRL